MRRAAAGVAALVLLLGARRRMSPKQPGHTGSPGRSGDILTADQLRALFADVGWPAKELERAVRIAKRESGGNPRAHLIVSDPKPGFGPEDSRGLFQINVLAWPQYIVRDLYNARVNAATALEIWRRAGWKPWRATAGP